jgi:phenylalanyl-tRNA synthetase alpha chain
MMDAMTELELAVLKALDLERERSVEDVSRQINQSPDSIRRVLPALEEKTLVRVERSKKTEWELTESGKIVVEKGLPEKRLCQFLLDGSKTLEELKEQFNDNLQEFSAAFGLSKRSNWIAIQKEGEQTKAGITELGKKAVENSPLFSLLNSISKKENPGQNSNLLNELKNRGLILEKTRSVEIIKLTARGKEAGGHAKAESNNQIARLTSEMIVSGSWKGKTFKSYEVTAGVEAKYAGKRHPLRHVMRDVRKIMVEMGFGEMEGPLVESAFWNMDSMFIPQDHPAREVQDTFYLSGKAVLEDADLVKRVKAVHEHGGRTGSKGFGYEWDYRAAMQLLLRTHTTATTFREFGKGVEIPQKKFSIGRIFRNEAVDATHLAEFYQVEGFVMGEGLTLRHLMGVIKEFYAKIGLTKIKFKPTYNPYTEPSMEASAYHPKLGWVEMINSGMFRPESLAPFGINVPVIAWGFGLERLALFIHGKKTLKEVIGPDVDLDFIRNYSGTKHSVFGGVEYGER